VDKKIYIELEGEAISLLDKLMKYFDETNYSIVIAKALGLAEAVLPFLDSKTTLTVVAPNNGSSAVSEDDLVDLVFETDKKAA
jgi:hypothetical protein